MIDLFHNPTLPELAYKIRQRYGANGNENPPITKAYSSLYPPTLAYSIPLQLCLEEIVHPDLINVALSRTCEIDKPACVFNNYFSEIAFFGDNDEENELNRYRKNKRALRFMRLS
ncbi:hypothetical protein NPIL_474971 [Nephila pilipes]|uniref:Uncharacterized protein n=1 Tax=Nephila pilipes TaxID=299642 RepID=A0A8X6N004_NEPPI|nr:hypothetical protein NPIL_474971 [Nephila pilipes]